VEDAAAITPAQVHEVLSVLKTMFPYVIVDTEIGYGDRNLSVFDSSDIVFLTGVLSLPALKNMQKALDVFERIGFETSKKAAINRYVKRATYRWRMPRGRIQSVRSIPNGKRHDVDKPGQPLLPAPPR
jgi:Flp pilus assembly CpaE family ATPase